MADYLTTDTELTSVANAIRTKGGTSGSLVYPDGFVSAIGAISTGTDVSDTTAAAADVRTGKYFYTSAGTKTQGTIADQAAQTITPTTTDQTIASGKYLTGTQTIKGDANLIAENIAKDVTIFGVTGTHEGGGGGGGTYGENDVVFYDNLANNGSGGIVFSCSASEFASMTELPANPDHSNYTTNGISIPMTSQGWTYSLSDAKSYVQDTGSIVIGQLYVPTDGKTHHVCYIPGNNQATYIGISSSSTVDVQIDNGAISSKTGEFSIDVPSGWHDVKISGSDYTLQKSSYNPASDIQIKLATIMEIYVGDNTKLWSNAFAYCVNLRTITFPVTTTVGFGGYSFYYCKKLLGFTTKVNNSVAPSYGYYECNNIERIISTKVIQIGSSGIFVNNYNLKELYEITSITNSVSSAYGLKKIVFGKNIIYGSIGSSSFGTCYSLREIIMKSSTPPTLPSSSVFASCDPQYKIIVPAGSRATYISASNWSAIADHIVERSS